MSYDQDERRRYPRLDKKASLQVQILSYSPQPEQQISEYRDVGGGGMKFVSDRDYPEGTLLKIQAKVPGWGSFVGGFQSPQENESRSLVAVAEVVRSVPSNGKRYEIGVKFVNLYESDHRALVEYINSMVDELE